MSWVTDPGACQTENGKLIFCRIPSGPRHTENYSSWQQLNRNPCSPYMDGGRNANSRSITRFDSTMSLNDKKARVSHIVTSCYRMEWKITECYNYNIWWWMSRQYISLRLVFLCRTWVLSLLRCQMSHWLSWSCLDPSWWVLTILSLCLEYGNIYSSMKWCTWFL